MSPVVLGPYAQQYKQCQHCHKPENIPDFRLLSCSKCSRCHYCNRTCQLADWPKHKATCRNNATMLGLIKGKERMKQADSSGPPIDRKETESKLKRWIQVHRPLLNLTLTNALTLQITPDRCRTDVLFLVLNPNFSSDSPARFFTVDKTEVSSLSDTRQLVVQKLGPEQDVLFTQFLAQSQDIRNKGGVGIAMMAIMVPQAGILHMTPFGMPDMLTEADVRLNKDWEENLKAMVERGVAI